MQFTMKAYKFDNRLHYESPMELVEQGDKHIVLFGPPGRSMTHYTGGKVFTFENQSLEFYFTDRWYTVACVVDLEGKVDFYYCNIAMPCTFTENAVHFIDLDLDVIIQPDLTWTVVDQDEFLEHQLKYGYGGEIIRKTEDGVKVLVEDMENKRYPFDGVIDTMIEQLGLCRV